MAIVRIYYSFTPMCYGSFYICLCLYYIQLNSQLWYCDILMFVWGLVDKLINAIIESAMELKIFILLFGGK